MTTKRDLVEGDVPLDQRQRALSDRAEADHHDRGRRCGHAQASGHGSVSGSAGISESQATEVAPHKYRRRRRGEDAAWRRRRGAERLRPGCRGTPAGPARDQAARAVERARRQFETRAAVRLVGPGQPQRAGLSRREAEAAVVGRVADQQHGGVAGAACAARARAASKRRRSRGRATSVDRERAEQQRRPRRPGRRRARAARYRRRGRSRRDERQPSSAGKRPSRRRSDGLAKRAGPKRAIEQRLRAPRCRSASRAGS